LNLSKPLWVKAVLLFLNRFYPLLNIQLQLDLLSYCGWSVACRNFRIVGPDKNAKIWQSTFNRTFDPLTQGENTRIRQSHNLVVLLYLGRKYFNVYWVFAWRPVRQNVDFVLFSLAPRGAKIHFTNKQPYCHEFFLIELKKSDIYRRSFNSRKVSSEDKHKCCCFFFFALSE
jgi:hypothetical protein